MTKQTKKLDLQKKIEDLEIQLKRTLADYQNLERRAEQEKEELGKFAATIVMAKFLPVLDNLKKAAEHISDSGLKMVISQFEQVLRSEGVEEIKIDKGSNFDPKLAEAVEVVKGQKNGEVTEVVQAGYTISGKLLRPAQVKVSKTKITESDEKATETPKFGDYV